MFTGPNVNEETQKPKTKSKTGKGKGGSIFTGSKAEMQTVRVCLVGEKQANWIVYMYQDCQNFLNTYWIAFLLATVGSLQITDYRL